MSKNSVKIIFFYQAFFLFLFMYLCNAPVFSQTGENVPNNVDRVETPNDSNTLKEGSAEDAAVKRVKKEVSDKEIYKKQKSDDIELRPVIIKGIENKRKKNTFQDISRHSMTARDLKEIPASFRDSISALTALPGIIRAGGGIFGPLIIRGADMLTNSYFIDDIPINNPLHFGGLHSVINTNLISEIDVYSSSFPVQFGSATSAVISITTVDEVDQFGGYADISLLSTSVLVGMPILRDKTVIQ